MQKLNIQSTDTHIHTVIHIKHTQTVTNRQSRMYSLWDSQKDRQKHKLRHTHTHTYTHAHLHTHTYTHTHTHKKKTHLHTYTHLHAYTHLCMNLISLWSHPRPLLLMTWVPGWTRRKQLERAAAVDSASSGP